MMASDAAAVHIALTVSEAVELTIILEGRLITQRQQLDSYRRQGGEDKGRGEAMAMCEESIAHAQSIIRKIDQRRRIP